MIITNLHQIHKIVQHYKLVPSKDHFQYNNNNNKNNSYFNQWPLNITCSMIQNLLCNILRLQQKNGTNLVTDFQIAFREKSY